MADRTDLRTTEVEQRLFIAAAYRPARKRDFNSNGTVFPERTATFAHLNFRIHLHEE